jgi:hypothetical protein
MGAHSGWSDPDGGSRVVGMTTRMTMGAFDSASNGGRPDSTGEGRLKNQDEQG